MDEAIKVIIRPAVSDDKNFILSTWLKGNYFGCYYFRMIPQDLYFEKYSEIISKILFTPGVQINVACDENRPDWIVGFSVFDRDSLYWVHVKKDYRERGIANLLIANQAFSVAKAVTKIGRAILEKKGLIFNPL